MDSVHSALEEYIDLLRPLNVGTFSKINVSDKNNLTPLTFLQSKINEAFEWCIINKQELFSTPQHIHDLIYKKLELEHHEEWQMILRNDLLIWATNWDGAVQNDDLFNRIQNLINAIKRTYGNAIHFYRIKDEMRTEDIHVFWGYLDFLDYIIETDSELVHLHLDCSD